LHFSPFHFRFGTFAYMIGLCPVRIPVSYYDAAALLGGLRAVLLHTAAHEHGAALSSSGSDAWRKKHDDQLDLEADASTARDRSGGNSWRTKAGARSYELPPRVFALWWGAVALWLVLSIPLQSRTDWW
jgi:hypothetical protein